MKILDGLTAKLRRLSKRQLLWRPLLAVPFALALILTLILGPATIDNRHASFVWLAVLSLVAVLLMLVATERLLIPVGLVAFLVFPLISGLGFNFAPGWTGPVVGIIFYGSMLASAGAVRIGIRRVLKTWSRRKRLGSLLITAGAVVLAGLAVAGAGMVSARSRAARPGYGQNGPVNLGPVINTVHREAEPTFTADGRTMYFNGNDYDIYVSHLIGTWEEGRWTPPRIVGPPISTSHLEVEPVINAAGDKLYFTSSRPFGRDNSVPGLSMYVITVGLINERVADKLGFSLFGGLGSSDVWVSYRRDGVWSEPRELNEVSGEPPVNSAFMDHCLSFSVDANEAFWTSDRPGGFGGNDIWTSRRVDGKWTRPENLGANVNGPRSEHHSTLTPDGRSMYITSDRAGGFGGDDIYVTTRGADGRWGPLVNLGRSVNGRGNDRCAVWTPDQRVLLFDSDRAGGFGSKDIWWIYAEGVVGRAVASSPAGATAPLAEGSVP